MSAIVCAFEPLIKIPGALMLGRSKTWFNFSLFTIYSFSLLFLLMLANKIQGGKPEEMEIKCLKKIFYIFAKRPSEMQ